MAYQWCKKNNLVSYKRPMQFLDNATITAENKYPINFTESENYLCKVWITMEAMILKKSLKEMVQVFSANYNPKNTLHEKPYFLFLNVLKRWSFQKIVLEYDFYCIIRKVDICFLGK